MDPMRNPIYLVLSLVFLLSGCAGRAVSPDIGNDPAGRLLSADLDRAIPELAEHVRQERPEQVTAMLAPCLGMSGPNGALEQRCVDLYSNLAPLDNAFVRQLNAWLRAEPENVHAKLIAAGALITRAWTTRGHEPEERTHPVYLHRFRQTLLQAADQAAQAIRLAPDQPYGYLLLSTAYAPLGEDYRARFDAVLARAEEAIPWNYQIALTRLILAQPRLGGSREAMTAVIDAYRPYRSKDAYFHRLDWVAEVLATQASRSPGATDETLVRAEANIVDVIDRGLDRSWVYHELAEVRSALGDDNGARAAMAAAVARDPYGESRLFSALCACARVSADTALMAGRRYVERYPESFPGWVRLAAVHEHYREDRESALAALEEARALRPEDPAVLLGIREYRRALGLPVSDRLETRDYKRDLIVYSHRGYAHMAQVREQVKARFGGHFDGENRRRFDQAVDLYFTEKTFDTRFRLRLETLDWTDARWAEVATLFADSANIVAGVSPQTLNALRAKYSQPEHVEAVRAVYAIRDQVTERMVEDFIQQLNDSGSTV